MFKSGKLKYIIKSVSGEDSKALEELLNQMSADGWDLYSMQEAENDDGLQINCIFVTDNKDDEEESLDDSVLNISNFKSQMEKMLTATLSPYESCCDIQTKIREQKKKIAKIKSKLENEAPSARTKLNEQMSAAIKELEELKGKLIKALSPDMMYEKLGQEKLSINMSQEIIDFVNPEREASLLSETVRVRQKLTEELGYIIPKVVFQDDDNLAPYEFSINVRGLAVMKSLVYPDYLMFFEDELKSSKKIKNAIYTVDEISGKKIVWIEKDKAKSYWAQGFTPSEFIGRALEYCAIKHVDEILDYEDVNRYIDIVGEKNLFLVDNIVPEFISVAELRYLLSNLIREEVSIKDIVYIFEKINDYSDEPSKEDLLDKIRLSLARFISKKYCSADNILQGLEVSEKTLDTIFGKSDLEQAVVRIDGTKVEKIAKKIKTKAKSFEIEPIVLFVPIEVRHIAFTILSQFINGVVVLAKEEVSNDCVIEILEEV